MSRGSEEKFLEHNIPMSEFQLFFFFFIVGG